MKISVSSYSFSQLLRSGEKDQLGLIALAKELGFDGIEFTDLETPEGVTEAEYAEMIRKEAERLSMEVVSYTIGANLLAPDFDAEIERVCRKVDIAAILGVKTMRHDCYYAFPEEGPKEFDYWLDHAVEGFRRITEYAKTKGVRTCTENHGYICQDSERVERFMKGVNDPNFGWLLDMGNFLCADEDPLQGVARGAKYAIHVHMKDFFRLDPDSSEGFPTRGGARIAGATLGKGIVPVKQCVDMIRAAGYDGFFTIEYEGTAPCIEALKEGLAFARSL